MIQNELDIRLKPAIESTSSTKVPLDGEIVLVKDTSNSANNNIRIGNGSTAISSLSNFLTMGGQGGGGTVTSVRVQATSPVQSSESSAQSTTLNTTISLADAYGDTKNPYDSKTANYVLAAPNGSAGAPSFRALVAADIPNLSWNKITSDKPTTLSGYGITDASISNGTITLGSNTITPATSNSYHTSGSWNGLTYTATSQGGAGTLAFTIPTGNSGTTVALGSHVHGQIRGDGRISTSVAIASGDTLIIGDSSDYASGDVSAYMVKKSALTFDGTTTTQFLSKKGTWETPSGGGSYTLPTATQGVLGGLLVYEDASDTVQIYSGKEERHVSVPIRYASSTSEDMALHYVNIYDVVEAIGNDIDLKNALLNALGIKQ